MALTVLPIIPRVVGFLLALGCGYPAIQWFIWTPIAKMAKKYDSKEVDYKEGKDCFEDDEKWDTEKAPPPTVNILGIEVLPSPVGQISSPLELKITFDLDRDCVASFWQIKFLVDSCNSRIIRVRYLPIIVLWYVEFKYCRW